MTRFFRKPIRISERHNSFEEEYDLILVALGYEERSRALAESYRGIAAGKLAVGFHDRHDLSYLENFSRLKSLGYKIEELSDAEFDKWWAKTLQQIVTTEAPSKPIRICIDISSQTRSRLATIVQGLCLDGISDFVFVDFVYSYAKFSAPDKSPEFAAFCGPVTPFFAGWPADPDFPTAAVIGLGYEIERAIGAYEYLEPTSRIVMIPKGLDSKFDREVEQSNKSFLKGVPIKERFSYRVDRPESTFQLIESIAFELLASHRLIMLPFGPKLFALSCLLSACVHYPQIGIWRVSPGSNEKAQQRQASGDFIVVKTIFSAR